MRPQHRAPADPADRRLRAARSRHPPRHRRRHGPPLGARRRSSPTPSGSAATTAAWSSLPPEAQRRADGLTASDRRGEPLPLGPMVEHLSRSGPARRSLAGRRPDLAIGAFTPDGPWTVDPATMPWRFPAERRGRHRRPPCRGGRTWPVAWSARRDSRRWVRVATVGFGIGWALLGWARTRAGHPDARGPGLSRRLRPAFERLGPTYIKLGQIISSGEGIFPDELVEEFRLLRDRVPPEPFAVVRRTVEEDLGPAPGRGVRLLRPRARSPRPPSPRSTRPPCGPASGWWSRCNGAASPAGPPRPRRHGLDRAACWWGASR